MSSFLSCFLQILLYTLLPVLLCGAAVSLLDFLFCRAVGEKSGRKFLLLTHVFAVPLRELGHLLFAAAFMHRIEDFRLLNLYDTTEDFGYVEHSFNRKNPVALLGNLFFALGPALLGLFVSFAVIWLCFKGAFPPYLASVRELSEEGAGFGTFLLSALRFFPTLFGGEPGGVFLKIVGCILLLLLCFGMSVSFFDLRDAASGIFLYGLLSLLVALVTVLLGERARRILLGGLHSFALCVTAVGLVTVGFAVLLTALGFLFSLLRIFLNLDAEKVHVR